VFALLCPASGLVLVLAGAVNASAAVTVTDVGGKVRVEIGGVLFTEYHYQGVSRPYLYPVVGPGGALMTRHWPMDEVAGEEHDHPHHRSLWWAHGDINGTDFWSESPKAGKTVHKSFSELKSGDDAGSIQSRNELVALDGKVVADEDLAIKIYAGKDERILDFDVVVHATRGALTFGDTKEGTMAIRLAETMRLVRGGKPGEGHIVTSEGVRDGDTWGKRADWVDYYGPVNGQIVGVAIFDQPKNPKHPTWWHVRDYGLFAANPFGVHEFEKKPADTGNVIVPMGKSIEFRYRFFFHRGDEKQAHVAERYAEYVRGGAPKAP